MNGSRNSNNGFMEGFLRGQDFVAQLQIESDMEEAQKAGMGTTNTHGPLGLHGLGFYGAKLRHPDKAPAGRYWEVQSDYGTRGLERTKLMPLSEGTTRLGPVTGDNGVAQYYAPAEWDEDFPTVPTGHVIDPLLDEMRRGPEGAGSFNQVAGFMYTEMKRNYNSIAAKALATANKHLQLKPAALVGWANLVWPGHVWDHKPLLSGSGTGGREDSKTFKGIRSSWYKDRGDQYSHDVWSNIHYGYIGRRAGFGADTLLSGAGAAQLGTLYGNEGMEEQRTEAWQRALHERQGLRGFDDPPDSAAVRLGIHLYEKYREKMTLDQFKEEVRTWPGMKVFKAPAQVDPPKYSSTDK